MVMSDSSSARVDFRTTQEVKSLIEQAAAVYGMNLSEFIKTTLIEKSREVLEQHQMRVLSDRDRDIFLTLLELPAAPNKALHTAALNFKKAVKDGSLQP